MEHNHEKMLDMVRHELPTDELLCDLSDPVQALRRHDPR